MGAAQKIIDKKTLQRLVPFNALSPVHFNEVAQKTVVEDVRAGRVIFKEGDHDNQSVYLLDGEVNLTSGNDVVGQVSAGSDASRHPLAQQQPRQVSARAKTNCTIARVDSSLLDIMLTWDQSSGYEVAEIDDDQDDDWMTRILQSQAFLKLPPSNIQRLLMSVESYPVKAGDVIIEQGGEGDYFYIIKTGRCMVTRKPSANAKPVKLAELADGDAFGEDALVSDAKRNASITMMTDGVLMRLAKKDFVELLKEPLLNTRNYAEAAEMVRKGAELLDVRLPGEYENLHIEASRNLPLSALRLEAQSLDRSRKYIVCCDTGRRSASAAFVLSQRGFDVYVLDQGFASVPAEALAGNGAGQAAQAADSGDDAAVQETPADAASAVVPLPAKQAAAQTDKAELQAAEQALRQAEQQVRDLREDLDGVRETAREQMQELEQALAAARQQQEAAAEEIRQLKAAHAKLQKEHSGQTGETERLEKDLEAQRSEAQRLGEELTRTQQERDSLKSELQREAQAQGDTAAELARLQTRLAQLEPLEKHSARQTEQLQSLQSEHDKLSRETERLAQEREALQTRLAQQEQQAGGQAEALAAQLQAAQAEIEQLTQTLAEAGQTTQARLGEVDQELDKARQAQQTEQQRANALETELTAAKTQAADAIAEQERLRELQAQAAEDVDRIRNEAEQTLAQAQSTHAEARTTLEGRVAELTAELEQTRARLQEQSGSADEQLQKAQADCQRLETELAEVRQGHATERETLDARIHSLTAELGETQERIATIQTTAAQQTEAVQAAETRIETLQRELQTAQAEAADRLAERETEFEQALAAARAEAGDAAAMQTQLDTLRQQLEAAEQARAQEADAKQALQQSQARLETEIQTARERLQSLEAGQAATDSEQAQALADVQAELASRSTKLQEADRAREEIEARLAEMVHARDSLEAELDKLRSDQDAALQAARSTAEQALREDYEQKLTDLKSELDGARAAVARMQSERDNLEAATEQDLSKAQAEARAETEKLEAELARLRDELDAGMASRADLDKSLQELRQTLQTREQAFSEAEQQRAMLAAELEQLRTATTADLQAMQKQAQSLQEELKVARKASRGGAPDEELERLRLLLDEAREEATAARSDADSWREVAHSSQAEAAASAAQADELDVLRVQLADVQSRVEEALQARDAAQREVAELRLQLQQARTSASQTASAPVMTFQAEEPPERRGGIWRSLLIGLLMGALGAGAALWYSHQKGGAWLPELPAAMTSDTSRPDTEAAAAVMDTSRVPPAPDLSTTIESETADPMPAKAATPPTGRTFRDTLSSGATGPEMIEINAASYSMGSSVASLDFDERPKHDVSLEAFAVGRYEVTFAEYDAFARATGRPLPDDEGWGRGQRPVINVTWDDALQYTRWLSQQTGKTYRLPSEAEWEYIAGGAGRTLYWWGNSLGKKRANCFNCGSDWDAKTSAPVGSFAANDLKVYDTAGNVSEWVQDCYNNSYSGAPDDGSAWVSRGCSRRVVRGGGFNSPANSLRVTKRDQLLSNSSADDVGFRVVRDL